LDIHKTGFEHGLACNEQEIMSWRDAAKLSLDRGSNETFGTVSLDCFAQTAPCGDTNTQALSLISSDDQHDKRVGKRLSRPPHPLEIG
jgi:hypothetical protein